MIKKKKEDQKDTNSSIHPIAFPEHFDYFTRPFYTHSKNAKMLQEQAEDTSI